MQMPDYVESAQKEPLPFLRTFFIFFAIRAKQYLLHVTDSFHLSRYDTDFLPISCTFLAYDIRKKLDSLFLKEPNFFIHPEKDSNSNICVIVVLLCSDNVPAKIILLQEELSVTETPLLTTLKLKLCTFPF